MYGLWIVGGIAACTYPTANNSEDQAIDRIHRLGQTRTVTVHRLLVEQTIEDRILAIQRHKNELVHHALASTPRDGTSDTMENLRLLFD